MEKSKISKVLVKYSLITLGCIIYSFGVAVFLDANSIAAGGVTGISILISFLSGWDTGFLIILINIPLLILGAVFFGKKFIISTLYSTLISSLMIEGWEWVFESFYHLPVTDNRLIASVVGGALFGSGIGIIFRMGSSTGGTDIIVKILRRKFRYLKTGIISMFIDITIVSISAFVYSDFELTCYTFLSLVVVAFTFDFMLYGGNSAKLLYIVTDKDHSDQICGRILTELDTGATVLNGKGAYTGNDKVILMCVIKNINYPRLRDVIREVDVSAFTIVTSAKEIYGEGYQGHTDDEI